MIRQIFRIVFSILLTLLVLYTCIVYFVFLGFYETGPVDNLLSGAAWAFVPVVILIIGAIFAVSYVISSLVLKKIIRPLNHIDLNEPLSNKAYPEIKPLLSQLHEQQLRFRRYSAELRQKREEFETITDNMNEGLILFNEKGSVVSINQLAKKVYHVSDEGDILEDPVLRELVDYSRAGIKNEKLIELDGFFYNISSAPVWVDGGVCGAVVMIVDVTERENSEQMRREFTANVSHELKTPLHSISGYAELLKCGMVQEKDIEGFACRIYDEAQRMIQLVEDIIKLSRLDEAGDDFVFEKVELFALAKNAVEHVMPAAQADNISMNVSGEEAYVYGDLCLLNGIINNLCDNAIKYNKPGGSVAVSVKNEFDAVRLTVKDTGIGIAPEYQERIFERFYRVDKSHSKAVGGTGLGLSIVKHAARIHGASIELESSPGNGTSISVLFKKCN